MNHMPILLHEPGVPGNAVIFPLDDPFALQAMYLMPFIAKGFNGGLATYNSRNTEVLVKTL